MRALTREEKAATLKRLRLAAGLGQRRLARASKLAVQVIAAMEHGRQGIGMRRARRIAKALGVDVKALLFAEWAPFGESNYAEEEHGDEQSSGSRSGTPTTPNAARKRPMVTITLSPEALARLDAIAAERGQTRSGAVEQLVRNARLATKAET